MERLFSTKDSTRSWRILPIKGKMRLTYCFLLLAVFACNIESQNSVTSDDLADGNGYYWDIVYNEGRYYARPIQGFCLKPDNTFFSYHYYKKGVRTPFIYGLSHRGGKNNIVSNLRPWELVSDSLFIDFMSFKVCYLRNDTLVLSSGIDTNPIMKLVRRKEPGEHNRE